MCAQIDELPDGQGADNKGGGGNLVSSLIAVLLAVGLSVGGTFAVISFLKPQDTEKPAVTSTDGEPLNLEPTGEEKTYELKDLITNLGGPIKTRYIDVELTLEGVAGDFVKVLEQNEYRVRDEALSILSGYNFEDTQVDGFKERVKVDLKTGFAKVLKNYREGESSLVRNIYFTQFVIQ